MPRPNFIIFLTDDQGYGDLSCMGATDFRTPHLDALAASGARFTDWYSGSPVCSPSRAALYTGRYPGNAGVRAILGPHRTATGLHPSVPTIAGALRGEGYRTALFGKWHLGVAEPCRPHNHGFDEWFGFMAGCVDYYSHISYYWTPPFTHDLWENNHEIYRNGEYLTEMITRRSVDFVRRQACQPEPFVLVVPYNAPHYPMHAPQWYVDRFPKLPPDRRIMAAMLSAVDDGVGEIVAELERQGVRDRTCIFFQSDNGPSREARNWLDGCPDPYYGGATGGLKGHKFSLYDGGIRVPGILSWPDRIPAGQVLHDPCSAVDIFPTFMQAAGLSCDPYELDGRSILPLVTRGQALPERTLHWEMDDQTAVRRGRWKLVLNGRLVEGALPEDAIHLSDLDADFGETRNLAGELPDLVADLQHEAHTWRSGIERRWKEEWASLDWGLTSPATPA